MAPGGDRWAVGVQYPLEPCEAGVDTVDAQVAGIHARQDRLSRETWVLALTVTPTAHVFPDPQHRLPLSIVRAVVWAHKIRPKTHSPRSDMSSRAGVSNRKWTQCTTGRSPSWLPKTVRKLQLLCMTPLVCAGDPPSLALRFHHGPEGGPVLPAPAHCPGSGPSVLASCGARVAPRGAVRATGLQLVCPRRRPPALHSPLGACVDCFSTSEPACLPP